MFRLLAILSVIASMMASSVLAFPNAPGACQASGMRAPHGLTPATDATYTVSVKKTAQTYSVTINGEGTYTGLLLYATDSATKARFGSFTKFGSLYAPYTMCKGENPKTNTLGHNSEAPKKLPVTFTWTDAGHSAGKAWKGSFTGIVMSGAASTWYVIPPAAVTGGGGGVPTNSLRGSQGANATTTQTASVPSTNNTTLPSDSSTPSDANNTGSAVPLSTDGSAPSSTPSSAAHLGSSFILCLLLSAFVLSVGI